jgi:hypothetical protein
MNMNHEDQARVIRENAMHARVTKIEEQLLQGDKRMREIENSIAENTTITSAIYEIIKMGKGFFKVIGWFGQFLKWAAPIAGGVVAIWAAIKPPGK